MTDQQGAAMINVLLPVDGSDGSARAVRMVIALCRRLAPVGIHMLYVEVADGTVKDALGAPASGPAGALESPEDALAPLEAMLDQAGIACTSAVRKGYVPATIIEYAKATNCDAIVMATRGMGSTPELLGSIARQVVSLADIPVTLVK
jgi:nucleotide-binding universal stress UspA family protein